MNFLDNNMLIFILIIIFLFIIFTTTNTDNMDNIKSKTKIFNNDFFITYVPNTNNQCIDFSKLSGVKNVPPDIAFPVRCQDNISCKSGTNCSDFKF